jgi:hypothetical protein
MNNSGSQYKYVILFIFFENTCVSHVHFTGLPQTNETCYSVLQEFEKLKRLNFSQLNKTLVHVVVVVGVSEIYGLPCGPSSVARAAPGQQYAAVCPFSVWLHIGWTPGVASVG